LFDNVEVDLCIREEAERSGERRGFLIIAKGISERGKKRGEKKRSLREKGRKVIIPIRETLSKRNTKLEVKESEAQGQ